MRNLIAVGIASLVWLGTTSALASAASYPMEEVAIVFGSPGEVLFDATGAKKLMPTPEEIRVFATPNEYYRFLESDLNAELVYDMSGDVVDYRLRVTTLGAAFYWDYSRQRFMDVPDAKAHYIGGQGGYVIIETVPVCVNPAICNPEAYTSTSKFFESLHGSFKVEASLPTRQVTVNGVKKIERQFVTRIVAPDPAKLLDSDACEACWNGHCLPFPCIGIPTRWQLEVDAEGIFGNGKMWDIDPRVVQNEVEVSVADRFPEGTEWDLACSGVNSRGEVFAPFLDETTDYLEVGACP